MSKDVKRNLICASMLVLGVWGFIASLDLMSKDTTNGVPLVSLCGLWALGWGVALLFRLWGED